MLHSILNSLVEEATAFLRRRRDGDVGGDVDPQTIRQALARYDFAEAVDRDALLGEVIKLSEAWTLHSTHPRYFGLFNPPSLPITVAADALVALYNPQVGTWSHAPFAEEVERHVLRYLGARLGYVADGPDPAGDFSAHFTSGGQEANATAIGAALMYRFPELEEGGLRSLPGSPVVYVSRHAHHSFFKACKMTGLGTAALTEVPVDERGAMDARELERHVAADRADGRLPVMVVATLGTTGMGVIDPVKEIARVCEANDMWCHADAAWGGSVLLSERHRGLLDGVQETDSTTWDAHKWLSVPMGAGMFFTRRAAAVTRLYRLQTGYVPSANYEDVVEPYAATAQWSRRFIGLKLFMALAELGQPGYEELLNRQVENGQLLARRLAEEGWDVVNETPLPVVCFRAPGLDADGSRALVRAVVASREAWVSTLRLPDAEPVIRACVTSFDVERDDVEALVEVLGRARAGLARDART